jgi:hypothetical protein
VANPIENITATRAMAAQTMQVILIPLRHNPVVGLVVSSFINAADSETPSKVSSSLYWCRDEEFMLLMVEGKLD